MESPSITRRELSLITRKHCQEALCSLVFRCLRQQARRSAVTCLPSQRSYRTGNASSLVPENLFDRAFLRHYWEAGAKLWRTARNVFLVCSNPVSSQEAVMCGRRSKQASTKLGPQQHSSGAIPQCLGQAISGYKCESEKKGRL